MSLKQIAARIARLEGSRPQGVPLAIIESSLDGAAAHADFARQIAERKLSGEFADETRVIRILRQVGTLPALHARRLADFCKFSSISMSGLNS